MAAKVLAWQVTESSSIDSARWGGSSLKRECLHFDDIFIIGCAESRQSDKFQFQCSQRFKFRQNDFFVLVMADIRNIFGYSPCRRKCKSNVFILPHHPARKGLTRAICAECTVSKDNIKPWTHNTNANYEFAWAFMHVCLAFHSWFVKHKSLDRGHWIHRLIFETKYSLKSNC